MKILLTTPCKPIPIFLGKYLSIDDVSYRFIGDQGLFSATAEIPHFSLHFLAQNLDVPAVVLEWPTLGELEAELQSEHYDYIGITFKVLDLAEVDRMIEVVRHASPMTKIVLGGYGTLALNEPEFAQMRDRADHICWTGDGVQFMQRLIGEAETGSRVCHLPVEEVRIPWLSTMSSMRSRVGYILSALGCAWKCEFCCTSAYAGGRFIEVMTPEEIVESMQWYYRQYPDLKHIYIMDEELLLRRRKVDAIGELIRADQETGLAKMNYLAFGTIKAISRWDPEALLLNGIGIVWTGVESMYSYQKKKGDTDQKSLVHALHQHGIESQLSWIVGDDCQTKENIESDIENLLDHRPCTLQLTGLSAFPGTALYERLKKEGRVTKIEPGEFHLFGNTMNSLHFSHEDRLKIIGDTYRRIYERQGPTVMKTIDIHMNGYEFCSRSENPHLNGPKREFFRKSILNSIPLVKTAIEFAPSVEVKQAMVSLHERYEDIFGPLRKSQRFLADRILGLAEAEMQRRAKEGYSTLRDVPLKRYTYEGR